MLSDVISEYSVYCSKSLIAPLQLLLFLLPFLKLIKDDYRVFVIESHDYYKDYLLIVLFVKTIFFFSALHIALFDAQTFLLLTKTTTTQNEFALRYHIVRGLYFPAVAFATIIVNGYNMNYMFIVFTLFYCSLKQ